MRSLPSILFCLLPLQLLLAEDVTLVAASPSYGVSGYSETIILNSGDTARFESYQIGPDSDLALETSVGSIELEQSIRALNLPLVVAGPATIRVRGYKGRGFVTFSITRAGLASPPAAIPQEAGTTWEVILESSSDLINWTPANPGQYGGIEPKRFFRTRMVKTSDP